MLGIGSVQGGPEVAASLFGRLQGRLMKVVTQNRGGFKIGSCAALNVVFHIPGSIIKEIPYEGLRDGKFSREEQMLMIQVAVPKEIASSNDENVVQKFLFDSLREANKIGAKFFKKKGMEYSQPKYLGLVDAVEEKFKQTV